LRLDREPQDGRLFGQHDSGGDVIFQSEYGDSRFADGKGRRRDDRWQQAFKALACFGQFRRNAWATGMDLGADVMGDKANNPFAIGRRQPFAGVRKPIGEPVDPDAAIRIKHNFDDAGIFKPYRYRGSQSRAQHARAARNHFRSERIRPHVCPRASRA
jgi:hypothetical protein